MSKKHYLLYLALPTVLLMQNCIKEKENVIPEVSKVTEHWGYEHPESWGGISGNCAGVVQSPIDITTSATVKNVGLPGLQFNYSSFPISIVDNGHTIQVNTNDYAAANTVLYREKTYKLKQFHFHSMSEHTINGEHSPMEMHLVHAADDGALLVVGLMIKEGTANNMIQLVWNSIPLTENKEEQRLATINVKDVLPAIQGYYNYIGSLTTPPCAMGLNWFVMKEPLYLSAAQISAFRNMYDHNYRPVQPLNNRTIHEKP